MISLETKSESKVSSPIGLSLGKEAKDEPKISFSDLLKGAKDSKDDKNIQNGSFVLSLASKEDSTKDSKGIKLLSDKETLGSLLKNDDKDTKHDTKAVKHDDKDIKQDFRTLKLDDKDTKHDTKAVKHDDKNIQNSSKEIKHDTRTVKSNDIALQHEIEVLEFNPKITQNLSVAELKTLIVDAKQFLKNKIINSDDFKMSQVKDLPKTLKGLTDMAKSFGIDLSKITIEEVKAAPKSLEIGKVVNQAKNSNSDKVADEKQTVNTKDVKKVVNQANNSDVDDVVDEKQSVSTKDVKKVEAEAEDVVEIKVKTPKTKSIKAQNEQDAAQEVKVKDTIKEDVKVNDKRVETIKEVKSTPLFKTAEKTDLTTEQIVQTKQFKVEDKNPKSRADETLKLLLRGEKPSQAVGNTTADFSVATAKVIAPSATSEVSKSIEKLLHGVPEESTSKTDGLTTHKADSFEVKLNEAKQMVKYLSADVKTAIEDYKAPFTRVKVQLNPQKMGEVDVTIVQRGKNLHVNISSNTAAINTLAINANELKTQLSNNGINNASLNFNNSEQNSEQQASHQQQNRQNERRADEEYNYFDNEEQNEEVLSSLEIVVPNYA